jgi:nitrogen fixation protein NifU and related proteins
MTMTSNTNTDTTSHIPKPSLYREAVLQHAKSPYNYGIPSTYDVSTQEINSLCGDDVTVYAAFAGDEAQIQTLMFTGTGCAVMKASASLMTTAVKQQSSEYALHLISSVRIFLHTSQDLSSEELLPIEIDIHSPLYALAGVRGVPARVKCALLPWLALEKALTSARTFV